MHGLLETLRGEDRRSIGQVPAVVERVEANFELFPVLIEGMRADDPIVRMRSADAAAKVAEAHPEVVRPHRETLLELLRTADQQEVRWHLCELVPGLDPSAAEVQAAIRDATRLLDADSNIAAASALECLDVLAHREPASRDEVGEIVRKRSRTSGRPSPSERRYSDPGTNSFDFENGLEH